MELLGKQMEVGGKIVTVLGTFLGVARSLDITR
jgi:hypothetical protein